MSFKLQKPARALGGWLIALTVPALSLPARPAAAAETRYFDHAGDRYLLDGQREGGAVFVPSAVTPDTPVPLVVFLHGTNARRRLHPWLRNAEGDLRPLAESLIDAGEVAPFVLAGPTQTRDAVFGTTLWNDFNLRHFVSDVSGALGDRAVVDERAVALFGHSGAGCNPSGGLVSDFDATGGLRPFVVVAIDPCLDAELGAAAVAHSPEVPFWLLWQTAVWRRDFEGWLGAVAIRPAPPRITVLDAPGKNPHDSIVPLAFATALRQLFAPAPPEPAPVEAHDDP